MSPPGQFRSTAVALGIISLAAIVAGVTMVVVAAPEEGNGGGGLLIRVGAVLGAVALVLPTVRRPSTSRTIVVAAGMLVVLARPGLLWAVALGWGLAWWAGRQRRTADRDS